MKKKSRSKPFSRRRFVQGMGAGIVGGYALAAGKAELADPGGAEEKSGAKAAEKAPLALKVNGKTVRAEVEPRTTLLALLRDHLKLTGAKQSCNHGECGSCTVVLNGKEVYSCHLLALDAAGGEVITIEGLLDGEELHPLQKAFAEHDGFQCGFCTPGQILAAHALLLDHPRPTREQVLRGMSGNLCRCSAYPGILKSVLAAAEATPK